MQKEIKFRGWDKKGKMMRDISGLHWNGIALVDISFHAPDYPYGILSLPIDEIELMQYTGLKDKNGKEIYEGDVLAISDEEHVSVTDEGEGPWEDFLHLLPVSFEEGAFGVKIKRSPRGAIFTQGFWSFAKLIEEGAELEVIGTLYENPDLPTA